jgi:hypothetical protein
MSTEAGPARRTESRAMNTGTRAIVFGVVEGDPDRGRFVPKYAGSKPLGYKAR